MLSKFYIQFLTFIAVICYAVNVNAQDHSLIAAAGQKVYVPLSAKSVKGKMTVSNYGRTVVRSFDYTLSFNGQKLSSKHYVMTQALNLYDDAVIDVDVPPST